MSLELFQAHNSTCSQKVRLCLAEKGIRDWISRPADISKRENLSPEFLAINPNGVVPAFRHDGRSIIESGRNVRIPRRDLSARAPPCS